MENEIKDEFVESPDENIDEHAIKDYTSAIRQLINRTGFDSYILIMAKCNDEENVQTVEILKVN